MQAREGQQAAAAQASWGQLGLCCAGCWPIIPLGRRLTAAHEGLGESGMLIDGAKPSWQPGCSAQGSGDSAAWHATGRGRGRRDSSGACSTSSSGGGSGGSRDGTTNSNREAHTAPA